MPFPILTVLAIFTYTYTPAGATTVGPTTAGATTAGATTVGPTTAGATTAGPTTAGATTAGATVGGTTSGATTTGPTTTNANPIPSINQICPENPGMNDRIRLKALQTHNYRRSLLAEGGVKKNTGRYLPPATNMLKLKYDCTLETSAKQAVDRCSTSPSLLNSTVEENIHSIPKALARYRIDAVRQAVKHWWSQVRLVDGPGMLVTYRSNFIGNPISSFTRMAWATTQYLGCAVSERSLCGDNWLIACHYKTGGNIPDSQIYERGTACTSCPAGTFCNLDKLCESLS